MTLKQQNYTCLSDDTYAKGWNRTPDLVLPDRKRIFLHNSDRVSILGSHGQTNYKGVSAMKLLFFGQVVPRSDHIGTTF